MAFLCYLYECIKLDNLESRFIHSNLLQINFCIGEHSPQTETKLFNNLRKLCFSAPQKVSAIYTDNVHTNSASEYLFSG